MKSLLKKIKNNLFPHPKISSVEIPVFKGDLLNGKTALIIGGSGGIGSEIAKTFVENGCRVVLRAAGRPASEGNRIACILPHLWKHLPSAGSRLLHRSRLCGAGQPGLSAPRIGSGPGALRPGGQHQYGGSPVRGDTCRCTPRGKRAAVLLRTEGRIYSQLRL